jgi:hypothetical protein
MITEIRTSRKTYKAIEGQFIKESESGKSYEIFKTQTQPALKDIFPFILLKRIPSKSVLWVQEV